MNVIQLVCEPALGLGGTQRYHVSIDSASWDVAQEAGGKGGPLGRSDISFFWAAMDLHDRISIESSIRLDWFGGAGEFECSGRSRWRPPHVRDFQKEEAYSFEAQGGSPEQHRAAGHRWASVKPFTVKVRMHKEET